MKKMKNLSNYNVTEISKNEAKKTSGGFLGALGIILALLVIGHDMAVEVGESVAAAQCQ